MFSEIEQQEWALHNQTVEEGYYSEAADLVETEPREVTRGVTQHVEQVEILQNRKEVKEQVSQEREQQVQILQSQIVEERNASEVADDGSGNSVFSLLASAICGSDASGEAAKIG